MNIEMQQQKYQLEQNSTNGSGNGVIATATSPPAFTSPDRRLPYLPDDSTFLNLCSAFSPISSTPIQTTIPSSASLPQLPSSLSNGSMTISSTDRCLHLARLTLQYREMEDRYEFCLSHLRETMEEVESLRHEISRLRKANTDLTKQLNPNVGKQQMSNALTLPTPLSVINDLRRLNFEDSSVNTSPTSVLSNNRIQQAQRISFPKSISVRPNEFVKVNSTAIGRRITSPPLFGSQRMYEPGKAKAGEQEQGMEPMEFEVYGQGMFKTELCNKWEETGACPYGDHCQFAHGIAELRPVIRHPRYKTEVCRMVLAGEACPYGHRCHFRHGITPNDRGFPGPPGFLP